MIPTNPVNDYMDLLKLNTFWLTCNVFFSKHQLWEFNKLCTKIRCIMSIYVEIWHLVCLITSVLGNIRCKMLYMYICVGQISDVMTFVNTLSMFLCWANPNSHSVNLSLKQISANPWVCGFAQFLQFCGQNVVQLMYNESDYIGVEQILTRRISKKRFPAAIPIVSISSRERWTWWEMSYCNIR